MGGTVELTFAGTLWRSKEEIILHSIYEASMHGRVGLLGKYVLGAVRK
jgi:hypothetical protein